VRYYYVCGDRLIILRLCIIKNHFNSFIIKGVILLNTM